MSATLLAVFFRGFVWWFTHHITGIEKEEHGNNPVECGQKQDNVKKERPVIRNWFSFPMFSKELVNYTF